MKLNRLTIQEASEKLRNKEISSVELTRACLKRIGEVNDKLNACLAVCEDRAIREARAADERLAAGETGVLLGIPYLAKDNIMTRGVKTTAASKMLAAYTAPFDATVIKKLKAAGAVLLGKTNLDEFAHGASTENSAFGPTRNPWDLARVPGGSSGGSAAAVAADMCLFALGTDTGGSIRHPAAFCGVVGLKPTYGRASRFGLIAMTSSTDVPGPLAKTAADADIVFRALAGRDEKDPTSFDAEIAAAEPPGTLEGIKIGLPKEYFIKGIDRHISKAIAGVIRELTEMGAEFTSVDLPHTKYAVPAYYIITPSEVSSNLARFDGLRYGFSVRDCAGLRESYLKSRGLGFGPEAKRRIVLGTYVLSAGYFDAYYLKAQKVRVRIGEEFDRVLKDVDCLLTPVTPHLPFKIGAQADDPLKMYLEDIFMAGSSLAGLPAVSLPAGFVRDLPAGFQLIGRRSDEATILGIGQAYENAAGWRRTKSPALK